MVQTSGAQDVTCNSNTTDRYKLSNIPNVVISYKL